MFGMFAKSTSSSRPPASSCSASTGPPSDMSYSSLFWAICAAAAETPEVRPSTSFTSTPVAALKSATVVFPIQPG